MKQETQVLLFNQQLDQILAGKVPDAVLSDLDKQALTLAQQLSQVNFSEDSRYKNTLYTRLVKISSTSNTKSVHRWLPSQNIVTFQVRVSTWVRGSLVLLLLLCFTLGFPNPSVIISTSNPNETYHLTVATANAASPIQNNQIQALQPVPIPTPLAIPALLASPGDPTQAQNTGLKHFEIKPDMAQTPKPIPISLPGIPR